VALGHQTFVLAYLSRFMFFVLAGGVKGGEVANGRTPFGFIASKSGNSQSHLKKKINTRPCSNSK